MKISIVLPDLCGGGVERVRLALAAEFSALGHDVEFALMEMKGELLKEAEKKFSVVSLNCKRARSIPFLLAKYLKDRKPDSLMVAMWPITVMAPYALLLSGCRANLLVSEHNSLSIQYDGKGGMHRIAMRLSMALGYRLANQRVVVSEGVALDISELSGLSLDSFTVIHNPVPPRTLPSDLVFDQVESMWQAPKGIRILSVGSLKRQKNHDLLIRAFSLIDNDDARLMIVGDGPLLKDLQSLACDLGVSEKVIFAGFHSDPSPFYLSADTFVLSSNYEGFGNVIVEAMSYGLPVVSTDCPSGPSEILDKGRFGRLVPVGDARLMKDAIVETLENPTDKSMLSTRANTFDPKVVAGKYLDCMFSSVR